MNQRAIVFGIFSIAIGFAVLRCGKGLLPMSSGSGGGGPSETLSAPTVSAIAPTSGATAGGTSVSISGTNFVSGAQAAFAGNNCTSTTFVSSILITCNTPARHEGQATVVVTNPDSQYGSLTNGFSFGGSNVWYSIPALNAPSVRDLHTLVWTGTEVIVWGGRTLAGSVLNTGAKYNPVTGAWTATNSGGTAPAARCYHTAVWTGSRMIVWGGSVDSAGHMNTGGVYDPVGDSWTATTTTGAPAARDSHGAVWTGTEMIVWGGVTGASSTFNDGGRYSPPPTNSWTAVSTSGAPAARCDHTCQWTGSRMLVWGGTSNNASGGALNSGGIYNPDDNSWTTISTVSAPSARRAMPAQWTGTELIVWGGEGAGPTYPTSGGRYNPSTDQWTAMSTTSAPTGTQYAASAWTGTQFVVWGGANSGISGAGGVYTPGSNSWSTITTSSDPSNRSHMSGIWTGAQVFIWGGNTSGGTTDDGSMLTP